MNGQIKGSLHNPSDSSAVRVVISDGNEPKMAFPLRANILRFDQYRISPGKEPVNALSTAITREQHQRVRSPQVYVHATGRASGDVHNSKC